jgi:ech hydrogenase subunit A
MRPANHLSFFVGGRSSPTVEAAVIHFLSHLRDEPDMQGYETAVWLVVVLPVLMGILAVPFKKKGALLALVGINAAVISALSIYLVTQLGGMGFGSKPLFINSEDLAAAMGLPALSIHEMILILDLALLAAFILIGVFARSALAIVLAVAQLIPLAWFETGNPAALEVESFALDHLSVIFVLICSIIGSIIAIFAVQYMDMGEHKQGPFFFFILTFLGVMNGAVLSNNMIYLHFFWECTTLCCYFLIKHGCDNESGANAKWALEVTMGGGAAILLGAFMFQQLSGTATLSMYDIVSKNGLEAIVAIPIFFFSFAAFTMAAQVPFQSWLQGAMVAPAPVSALIHSSIMVKLGVYLVIRMAPLIWQYPYLSLLIAFVGAYSFISTSLLALQEKGMKRLLAMSTVGNLGLIIALASIGTREALAAAVVLTIFHAISKALLFLAAGTVQKAFETRDIEGTEGLFWRAPSMFWAFFIGMMTMFLAPFGIFIANYTALTSSAANPLLMVLIVVGSIAAEVSCVRWLGRTMAVTGEPLKTEVSRLFTCPMWSLAAGAVALSVLLPFLVGWLVDPVVGPNRFDATLTYFSLDQMGVIPTFLIFVGLLFVVAYAMMDKGARNARPDTRGMHDLQMPPSCPFFEKHVDDKNAMFRAELIGMAVMAAAFIGALAVSGAI